MQKFLITFYILTLCLMSSCKSLSIQQESLKTTTQNMQLGTVGEQKNFVLEQGYNHTAIPNYVKAIKVNVNTIDFNKTTFKAFSKANLKQNQKIVINYIDSLESKPRFIKLEIADRVAVLNTLNSKENKEVFQFLENKREAHLISSIALALDNKNINAIVNAEEVFLEVNGIKSYALRLYKDKEVTQTILFKDGVVFAYKTSSCCWKQNNKYKLEIIDLVESQDKCPSGSYRNAKRANKKINYFKF